MTFAEKVISFHKNLDFKGTLPGNIRIMNPFRENPFVMEIVEAFYKRFYSDNHKRRLILGINPGRFGAGTTGIPFTDTVRLAEKCGLQIPGVKSFEPSSVFVYEMIDAYGGVEKFYSDYYISAVVPLGFTAPGKKEKHVNYNYYDDPHLSEAVEGFIKDSIETQLGFGILTDVCFCLGTGKNFRFLEKFNNINGYFGRIEPLEHPRFIMQYRSKQKEQFITRYVEALRGASGKQQA